MRARFGPGPNVDAVAKNASWTSCGLPTSNHDRFIFIFNWTIFSVQTVVFALRMLCRLVRIAPWGVDDLTIVFAYVRYTSPLEDTFPLRSSY